MVGPFIFFDQMGPGEFLAGRGLDVRPHPHIGLATVTYLFEGEILHRDTLGSVQPIQPGAVNWMTAGRGIAHSEFTPADHPPSRHGLAALGRAARRPRGTARPASNTTARCRYATSATPLSPSSASSATSDHRPRCAHRCWGGDRGPRGGQATAARGRTFEYGLLAMTGSANAGGTKLPPGSLSILEPAGVRSPWTCQSRHGSSRSAGRRSRNRS